MPKLKLICLITSLVIFTQLFTACRKIKQGITTSVHGRAEFDGKPVANVMVQIGEMASSGIYGNTHVQRYLDSATTDANGNYALNFTTTGEGSSYTCMIKSAPSNYFGGDEQEVKVGMDNTINFGLLKLRELEVALSFKNKLKENIYISSYWLDQHRILATTRDTTIKIKIIDFTTVNLFVNYYTNKDYVGVNYLSTDTIPLLKNPGLTTIKFTKDPSLFPWK